jgi:transposase-like protein
MTNEKRTRRDYDEAFKHEAVTLVTEQGYKMSEPAAMTFSREQPARRRFTRNVRVVGNWSRNINP